MLRAAAFAFAALSCSFATSQVIVHQAAVSPSVTGSCPIEFSAQRSGGPTMMIVDSGTHLPISQRVKLSFGNTTPHNISQMNVTVHGLTGNPHVIPVVMDQPNSGTRSTHAELKLTVAARGNASTSLRVDGITSISTIDLDSVLYDDGTEWHAKADKPCSIEPNGFMLVDSR